MEQRGVFWPMRFEATVDECVVEGEIPKDIAGGFYRNGMVAQYPTIQGVESVYATDGMVQGLVIENGKASFRNRWVRTPKFELERKHGRSLFEWSDNYYGDWRSWGLGDIVRNELTEGVPFGTASANAFPFGNEIIACGDQQGAPIALDPRTLETKGYPGWAKGLNPGLRDTGTVGDGDFAPHPKWDFATGEVFGWGYRDRPPFATVYRVKPDGTIESRTIDEAPYNTVAHDGWLTESYLILPWQPFTISRDPIASGGAALGWDEKLGIVFAVLDRNDLQKPIRWIKADIPPQYMMHMAGANEIDGKIYLDGPIFDRPPFMTSDIAQPNDSFVPFFQIASGYMGRWVIDVASGNVTSEVLDDIVCELPRIDERFYGRPYTKTLLIGGAPSTSRDGAMRLDTLMWRDVITGKQQTHRVSDDRHEAVLEPCFVPRNESAAEGDGYVIVPVSKFKAHLGEFWMYDTQDVSAGPIAKIKLPFHMGWTPHGHWMDFRDLERPN